MKNFIVNETQTFGKNHSKFQKHYFGINQFLRLEIKISILSDVNKISTPRNQRVIEHCK